MTEKEIELIKVDYKMLKTFAEAATRFIELSNKLQGDFEKLNVNNRLMMMLIIQTADILKDGSFEARGKGQLQ